MALSFFDELKNKVNMQNKCRIIIPIAQDEACAYAVTEGVKNNLIKPILIGDYNEIKNMYKAIIDSSEVELEIIEENDHTKACQLAVKFIKENSADIIMKGLVSTSTLLKSVLNTKEGIKKNPLLSHVLFFETEKFKALRLLSDAAINISPDIETLTKIVENSVEVYKLFFSKIPKVALLAANEKVSDKLPSTIIAKEVAEKFKNRDDVIVEGPISLDLSISKESVQIKNYTGKIQGDADILIVPRIETGNALYKSLHYFAHARMAGVVYGAKCPVVLTSRSDENDTKFKSLLLGIAIWQKQNNLI